MINFEEELKKFHPSLEVEDAEEAIYNQDLTDAADLLVKMMKEAEEKEEFWPHHCEDRVHCAGIWRGGRSGIPGHEFCGTEAVR